MRAAAILDELPDGTIELGCRYLDDANRLLDHFGAHGGVDASAAAVATHLVRPVDLADRWPDPTDPLPVGDGAVHADLIEEDRELFAALRAGESLADRPTAETLAALAQACRLPVTPYRRLADAAPVDATGPTRVGPTGASASLDGVTVVDLSALWAGPLATSFLAEVGVDVIKVDPTCRPDAFGEHPRLYRHLNDRKEIVDLDLRVDGDRRRFEALVRCADLVVESFSGRVMANLGYGPDRLRALRPSIATLSIRAFEPHSPQADWVAYGPGVHAMSGLAERPTSASPSTPRSASFRAAPIAYPDALAGMAAFAAAIELLAEPSGGTHRTVSLAAAIEPLASGPHPGERR